MKDQDKTLHTNTIQRLIRVLTPEESINPNVYYPFILLIKEIIGSTSPDVQTVVAKLSEETVSYGNYEILATLIERGEVATDPRTKDMVVSRLRNLRAGV